MFINLILTTIFFIVMMIGVIFFVVGFKDWALKRDEYYMAKLKEMRREMEELRVLFKSDVTEILNQVKNIIK